LRLGTQPPTGCIAQNNPIRVLGRDFNIRDHRVDTRTGRRFTLHQSPQSPPRGRAHACLVATRGQPPFAVHPVQRLPQECPQQLFRRNRHPPDVGLQGVEPRLQCSSASSVMAPTDGLTELAAQACTIGLACGPFVGSCVRADSESPAVQCRSDATRQHKALGSRGGFNGQLS
jgi:hypothetical protein